MQYFSNWNPLSPPSKKPARPENDVSPARRRTMLKSQPSLPILSGPQMMERKMWRATSESGTRPGSLEEAHEDADVFGSPEPAKDVTSASIHPSEGSYSARHDADVPDEEDFRSDPTDQSPSSPDLPEASQREEDEGDLSGITEVAHAPEIETQSSPIFSPTYSVQRGFDLEDPQRGEAKLKGISESVLLNPHYAPIPRPRSLLAASTNGSKRFSTGGIGIQFGSRDRRSMDLDINSRPSRNESRDLNSPNNPEPSLDWVRLEKNLDRIQSLLEQNSAQIRSLEHVQAANWERAVSMLMQNAEQIGELTKGQQRLGSMYEDLSKVIVESSGSASGRCEHDVRTPPKKLGRRIVGYVYEDKLTERPGRSR